MLRQSIEEARFTKDAGIAIGPILFVVAILGILASAIAAGSGSFTASSSMEGNRTKAAAMIDIGQNLKIGYDRITGSNGVDFSDVVISGNNTSNTTDLFSPVGGGISTPSSSLSATPSSDVWHYPRGSVPGVGTGGTNYDQIAILNVSYGVCAEIDNKVIGNSTVPSGDVGNLEVANSTVAVAAIASGWPSVLKGKTIGCIQNTGSPSGYYFYQIIGIQ